MLFVYGNSCEAVSAIMMLCKNTKTLLRHPTLNEMEVLWKRGLPDNIMWRFFQAIVNA